MAARVFKELYSRLLKYGINRQGLSTTNEKTGISIQLAMQEVLCLHITV
jgi:hypothetical protein